MLEVKNLKKVYAGSGRTFQIEAQFQVHPSERLAIFSPSGTGKSTLLRLMAGLDTPDQGEISLGGKDLGRLPPEKRNIGFVFQDYALFPGLTAVENVAYPLKLRGVGRDERESQARKVLGELGLSEEKVRQKIDRFSGGEKQRIAFARALSFQPDLLLLDEPFSALDELSRQKSRELLIDMHSRYSVPLIFVTHDEADLTKTATHRLNYEADLTAQDKEIHRFFR